MEEKGALTILPGAFRGLNELSMGNEIKLDLPSVIGAHGLHN